MNDLKNSEKNKEYFEDYNKLITIKDSIKSDLVKKLLEEVKEETNIENKINKNLNKKKNKNDTNNMYCLIQKIHPKSKTLKCLMKENQIKKINKNIKTKTENNSKNIISNNKKNVTKIYKNLDSNSVINKTTVKNSETKDTTNENNLLLDDIKNINKKDLTPVNKKQKKYFNNDLFKSNEKKELYHRREKSEVKKEKFMRYNELIINKDKNNNIDNLNKSNDLINNEINTNQINIINNSNILVEKTIKDFDIFLNENDFLENNNSPQTQKILNIFKKGNKSLKKNIFMPKYIQYSSQDILKELIFKNISTFLSPIEQYIFAKTNKDSLIKYMKSKGSEAENLLDKYKNQKKEIEKILNKNQNIKVNKENFFNDNKLNKIFELLNDDKYLEIFNNKSQVPDDNIIFVFKLFFLIIKGTDKLVDLKNEIFWEKISTYFINHTNEFNKNDYLLGELVKKILEQKLDFSEEKIQKIKGIVDQIDPRQIYPNTFKDISPTTMQFCFIIGYYLEFFGIIGKEWNPLENEYKEIIEKINELIKKINKIGLYIVNLKYKNQFK